MKKVILVNVIIMLVSVLAGCATAPVSQYSQLTWQQRRVVLTTIQNWTIKGVISIQSAQGLNMASISWQQNTPYYQLYLSGPLNLGSIKINGSADSVTLWEVNKAPVSAATPELLIQNTLGWQLPVTHLYYWIRGLSAPKDPSNMQFDTAHRLVHLVQDGWDIQYLQFTPTNIIDLPSKMVLTNPSLRVKLVIHQWQVTR